MKSYKLPMGLCLLFFVNVTSLIYATTPVNGKYYLSQWSSPSLHNALLELNALDGQVTLVIDQGSILTQSETVDPEVKLEFTGGGGNLLTVPGGYTLTIQSPIIAGFYQIFAGNYEGIGTIIVPGEKHIEWWGAVTGSVSAYQEGVNGAALQYALDNQGLITFTSAVYEFDDRVRMNSHTILQGSGKTRLKWTHNGVGIDFYEWSTAPGWVYEQRMENWAIRDLALEGANNGYSSQTASNIGLLVGYNASNENAAQWGGAHVERVIFYNWGGDAIKFNGCVWAMDVEGCRFENVYNAIYIDDTVSACTGIEISKCVFEYIGNDCLYAENDLAVKFGPGNMTEDEIKGYYTHLNGSVNPYVYGNRHEGQEGNKAFGHYWTDVKGGTFKGGSNEENIYLAGACVYNDIEVSSTTGIWKPLVTGGSPGVFEDVGGGCRDNKIVTLGGDSGYGVYGYGANSIDINSEVHTVDKAAADVTISRILTAATVTDPNPGTYLLDTTSNSITVNLPPCNANPFAEWTFKYIAKSGSNTVTIVPQNTGSIDSGVIDGYQNNYILRNVGDQVTIRPVPALTVFTGSYLKYLAQNWYSLNKQLTNTFTTANAATTTVSDVNVRATSVVIFYPINAAAAALQGSAKCLYLYSITDGSFVVKTASGVATGTTSAQFKYVIR